MPDNTMLLGAGGGMAPTLESSERGLTVSSVMKEIAVLKDKFKSEDDDHCEYSIMPVDARARVTADDDDGCQGCAAPRGGVRKKEALRCCLPAELGS